MPERVHVFIDGRVQGVGFRFSARERALALGLTGWVRNLPDGRVEAEFEGLRPALDAMLEWCWQGPSSARVTHVDVTWKSGESCYRDFLFRG